MSSLIEYIDSALSTYFQILNTKPKEGEEDNLAKFYNEKSMLTFGPRKLGAQNIVKQLRTEDREFHLDTYSPLSLDENRVIITGICILGNNKVPFTIALENQTDGDGQSNIYITNQTMSI